MTSLIERLFVVATFFFSVSAWGADLCFPTDVGNVVITPNGCDIKFDGPSNFKYRAYATEGVIEHEGCWYREDDTVLVLFPELKLQSGDFPVATYNALAFKICPQKP